MKKILAVLCALMLLAFCAISESAGGFEYTVNEDGNAVITGYTRIADETELVIPAEIDGYTVKGLAGKAITGKKWLVKVIVSEGIVSIGANAFRGNKALEEIVLPSTLTSVGNGIVRECGMLAKISVTGEESRIRMIEGCLTDTKTNDLIAVPAAGGMTEVIVPDGIKKLSAYAFDGCNDLVSVILPESLKEIGARAFRNCAALTEIAIPGGVTALESEVFAGCESLVSVTVCEGTVISETAFDGCNENLIVVTVERPVSENEATEEPEAIIEPETVTEPETEPEIEIEAEPAAPAPVYANIVKGCNVRSGAGTGYDKLGVLNEGARVQVLDNADEWYKVTDGKLTGYIYYTCLVIDR